MAAPYDLAVVGLGPAGRALAHRASLAGTRVLAVDPRPERRWPHTLAGWARQVPAWLRDAAIGSRSRPVLRTLAQRTLHDEYLVLDNDRLQDALPLDGVDVRPGLLDDAEVAGLSREARLVVDARGVRPGGRRGAQGVPAQTAYGVTVTREDAQPALAGAESVLMDWRPNDGRRSWGRELPSFLYVVPLPDGRVLVEETSLAAHPPMPDRVLRDRLTARTAQLGMPPVLDGPVERVHIDLARTGPRPASRFGAAGAQLNPVSGYSVFASLAAVDELVARVVGSGEPAKALGNDHPSAVRRTALAALLRLSGDDTVALFDAFAQLSPQHQAAVLDAATSVPDQLAAMGRQWWLMPPGGRVALVRATAGGWVAGLRRPSERRPA